MQLNRRKQSQQRGELRDSHERERTTIQWVVSLAGKFSVSTHRNCSVSSVISCSTASFRLRGPAGEPALRGGLGLGGLAASAPFAAMFDNPIRQSPFKADIMPRLLRLDPFVLHNLFLF